MIRNNLRILKRLDADKNFYYDGVQMLFRTTAYLTCTECGQKRTFTVEADILAEKSTNIKELPNWNDIALMPLEFNGICSNCKYDKAA